MGMSNRSYTKLESEWVGAVKAHGCLACIQLGFQFRPYEGPLVEAHHLVDTGFTLGNLFTVGLCCYHHRERCYCTDERGGVHGLQWHRHNLGPSLSKSKVAFHSMFGDNARLMADQRALLCVNDLAALVERQEYQLRAEA